MVLGLPQLAGDGRAAASGTSLAGADAHVVLVEVTTPEDAERLRFRGSPTVLVNGADPLANDSDPVGLSSRVFRTATGCGGGRRSTLVEVLRAAA